MESSKYLIGARVGMINNGFIYKRRGTVVGVREYEGDTLYDVEWDAGYFLSYLKEYLYSLDNGIDKLKDVL